MVRLKTITVHDGGCSPEDLEKLKVVLTRRVGKPCWKMEAEIAGNRDEDGGGEVTYWEEASDLRQLQAT